MSDIQSGRRTCNTFSWSVQVLVGSGDGHLALTADPPSFPSPARDLSPAQRSRAFLHQDVVICVLEDGATNAEKNLVAAGKADLVRVQRDALQRAMAPRLIAAVERLTHRTVRTFLSGSDDTGGSSVEAFVLEPEPAATPATPSPQIDPRAHQER
jgi:Na+-translocating membrane potential-generating system (MpsC)